jgi:hypothetical protein
MEPVAPSKANKRAGWKYPKGRHRIAHEHIRGKTQFQASPEDFLPPKTSGSTTQKETGSKIPDIYHVTQVSVICPPQYVNGKAIGNPWERAHGTWQEKRFPSMKPTSRFEADQLMATLESMLAEVPAETDIVPGRCGDILAQQRHKIGVMLQQRRVYDVCFEEVIRQVCTHVKERGEVLNRVKAHYDRLLQLYSQATAVTDEKIESHERKETQLQTCIEDLKPSVENPHDPSQVDPCLKCVPLPPLPDSLRVSGDDEGQIIDFCVADDSVTDPHLAVVSGLRICMFKDAGTEAKCRILIPKPISTEGKDDVQEYKEVCSFMLGDQGSDSRFCWQGVRITAVSRFVRVQLLPTEDCETRVLLVKSVEIRGREVPSNLVQDVSPSNWPPVAADDMLSLPHNFIQSLAAEAVDRMYAEAREEAVNSLFTEEDKDKSIAATILQAQLRGRIARRKLREAEVLEVAACTVQTMYRSHLRLTQHREPNNRRAHSNEADQLQKNKTTRKASAARIIQMQVKRFLAHKHTSNKSSMDLSIMMRLLAIEKRMEALEGQTVNSEKEEQGQDMNLHNLLQRVEARVLGYNLSQRSNMVQNLDSSRADDDDIKRIQSSARQAEQQHSSRAWKAFLQKREKQLSDGQNGLSAVANRFDEIVDDRFNHALYKVNPKKDFQSIENGSKGNNNQRQKTVGLSRPNIRTESHKIDKKAADPEADVRKSTLLAPTVSSNRRRSVTELAQQHIVLSTNTTSLGTANSLVDPTTSNKNEILTGKVSRSGASNLQRADCTGIIRHAREAHGVKFQESNPLLYLISSVSQLTTRGPRRIAWVTKVMRNIYDAMAEELAAAMGYRTEEANATGVLEQEAPGTVLPERCFNQFALGLTDSSQAGNAEIPCKLPASVWKSDTSEDTDIFFQVDVDIVMFVAEVMTHKYGLQTLVDQKIWDLSITLQNHIDSDRPNPELQRFNEFLQSEQSTSVLALHLHVRRRLQALTEGAWLPQTGEGMLDMIEHVDFRRAATMLAEL